MEREKGKGEGRERGGRREREREREEDGKEGVRREGAGREGREQENTNYTNTHLAMFWVVHFRADGLNECWRQLLLLGPKLQCLPKVPPI